MGSPGDGSIIHLNVGGEKFSTSRQTLTWIPESFFASLLSGRIPTVKDETGAIFIDRDPHLFRVILNYLRTKHVDFSAVNFSALKHEAQYYGLGPLLKRLVLCDECNQCECGDVLFHGYLPPPPFPSVTDSSAQNIPRAAASASHNRNLSEPPVLPSRLHSHPPGPRPLPSTEPKFQVPALPEEESPSSSRKADFDPPATFPVFNKKAAWHNRASSADYMRINWKGHKRISSNEARLLKSDLSQMLKQSQTQQKAYADPCRVQLIRGHHNWIAAGFLHFVCCFRMKDSLGWQLAYVTPRMDSEVRHIALNAKFGNQSTDKMLAAALQDQTIHLWTLGEEAGGEAKIGVFSLGVPIDSLFFIGNQLVALSKTGKVGIWHSMTQNWQVQTVIPISSYDTAGSFLLLGCTNGSIYYVDMQKFPLRMKDNDLLVTELYRDPSADVITSISVYLTPKTNLCGNWIEIAYGTSAGAVRVIVQHPETVGHGPQLFQTYSVHRALITNVELTTNHLIAVCSEYNHVRSWGVTRFRGMISTQPGSTPLASFKVLTLESTDWNLDYDAPDVGPFGDQDGEQVFIQRIVPDTDQLFVRLASNGDRVCVIKSVDRSCISSYLVHECEGSSRMNSRPRRYLFTGHTNGSIQMWDLTTALDIYKAKKDKGEGEEAQGPSPEELLRLIDECEITCNSLNNTPVVTPATSIGHLPGLFPK